MGKNKVGRAAMPWHIATQLWRKPKGDLIINGHSEVDLDKLWKVCNNSMIECFPTD